MQILDEEAFANVLRLERKRIERSGQQFVLLLLEPGSLLKDAANRCAFDCFLDTLLSTTRETDYKGWYGQESVFGIIFLDTKDSAGAPARQGLLQKLQKALAGTLTDRQINEIRVSFHSFPEQENESEQRDEPCPVVHRDVVQKSDANRQYYRLKRSLDVMVSIAALTVLSPIFLAIGIAIRLTSAGPILFRQKRVGQYFRPFTFLKFRSMYVDNDDAIHKEYMARFIAGQSEAKGRQKNGNAVFKLTSDPRVTRVGRFLRRTSLDELPQLINVLQGDMTLVGPRPCTAYEFDRYKLWHKRRLLIKPGITGLWQVMGRSSVDFDDMVRLDLEYVKARSFWLDLKILLRTPRAVILGEGAY
jgi:lipopolysaccharide/colanic/teichoic acid biosynthesis glycosyltransferase